MQAVLELVLLPARSAAHNVVPSTLEARETCVGGEGEEGIFMERTLDETTQRGQRRLEEADERTDEGSESVVEESLSRERCQF